MTKLTVQTISNLQNETSAVTKINANFTAIQTLVETLLSRDGETPNAMQALLDMNENSIINLPAPSSATEPARHGDIQTYVDQAEAAQVAAELAETNAETAEAGAEAALANFLSRYVGSYATAPSVDGSGSALTEGALYYNTNVNGLYMYTVGVVYVNSDAVEVSSEAVHISGWVALPANLIRTMGDVSIESITDDQIIAWSAGMGSFVAIDFSAANTSYDNSTSGLDATTVKAALDEITAGTSFNVYDIAFYFSGLLTDAENLYQLRAPRAFTIPADTTGFYATAGTAATGETVLTLKKNGTNFGTITFAASGSTGTWSIPGDTVFAAGDLLSLHGPSTPDTSLSDISITMIASR